jgi:hypothetical protein
MRVKATEDGYQHPESPLLKYFLQGLPEEGTVSTTSAYSPTPAHV